LVKLNLNPDFGKWVKIGGAIFGLGPKFNAHLGLVRPEVFEKAGQLLGWWPLTLLEVIDYLQDLDSLDFGPSFGPLIGKAPMRPLFWDS